jgi:predicted DNA-binding transcriptional regulator AlpA
MSCYQHLSASMTLRLAASSPTGLGQLIKRQGFPLGRYLGQRTRVWTEDEVTEWLTNRPAGRPLTIKDVQHAAAHEGAA